jgi:hypothetical protein
MDKEIGLEEYLQLTTNGMGSEILMVNTSLNLFISPLATQITRVSFSMSLYLH